jgi:hypothetical protein
VWLNLAGSVPDVALELEPPAALVPDPLAESTDREHALDLLPLPSDIADHVHQHQQDDEVDCGIGNLERPGRRDLQTK